jgi:hypothetical protein
LAETMNGREYLEEIIDRTVSFQESSRTVDLDLKISALILALEKLQRIRRCKRKPMSFEEFEQCSLFIDINKIVLVESKTHGSSSAGTKPIRMQAPLLLFLLLNHRDEYPFFEIIESFVGWI